MHRIQHMHNSGNIWYTQQNPPRARLYSWSRHPRPALGPQQRPGSAPLYGRLCYGVHTLPVPRDYPLGPLEEGLQLGQPRRLPSGAYAGKERGRKGEREWRGKCGWRQRKEEQAKPNPTGPESTAANVPADLTYESSCQSHTSFSSNQQDGRPGSSQTQVSTGATSTTADDIDTDSSIPSMSEQNYSTSSQMSSVNSPAYVKADSYSIVGSLNPGGMGVCINGTGAGGGLQLLNMATLKARDAPLQTFGDGKAPASEAPNPQPLRMEELLNIRLDRVTSDLSQPPYDSLQTYEFEGRDSRAESLSSLESDGDKEGERAAGEAWTSSTRSSRGWWKSSARGRRRRRRRRHRAARRRRPQRLRDRARTQRNSCRDGISRSPVRDERERRGKSLIMTEFKHTQTRGEKTFL
ncbi:uncharacterized protein LOC129357369 [Poeciliopsis prolifica]|nr:uncharacterized protein LOC129357369 [Poeciliopsis prolifica]